MAELVYADRPSYSYPQFFVMRIINLIFGVIETLLAFRFILKLLSANPSSGFVAWMYDFTDRLMGPFANAFPSFDIGGFMFETSTIFAIIAYAFISWLIVRLFAFAW